jgi:hypothetical protein
MPTLLIGLTDRTSPRIRLSLPPLRAGKTGSREADSLSAAWRDFRRYGRLTLVLSPLLLMVKVPADATGV